MNSKPGEDERFVVAFSFLHFLMIVNLWMRYLQSNDSPPYDRIWIINIIVHNFCHVYFSRDKLIEQLTLRIKQLEGLLLNERQKVGLD